MKKTHLFALASILFVSVPFGFNEEGKTEKNLKKLVTLFEKTISLNKSGAKDAAIVNCKKLEELKAEIKKDPEWRKKFEAMKLWPTCCLNCHSFCYNQYMNCSGGGGPIGGYICMQMYENCQNSCATKVGCCIPNE